MRSGNYQDQYLGCLLKGDRHAAFTVVNDFLKENPSIMDLYEQVIKISLYEVGKLWEANKISVAAEHLATAITEGILNQLFEKMVPSRHYSARVVVACVENEQHQVGIKMVADVFELQGWESYFLGNGIPVNELIRYIKDVNPDILAISLSVYFNYANLISMIQKVREFFPELLILIGGQAFNHIGDEIVKKNTNLVYLPNLYLLERFIESINLKL